MSICRSSRPPRRTDRQPHSAPTLWFHQRVERNRERMRKTALVALARKLLVALWKYVNAGVVIEGAVMRVA